MTLAERDKKLLMLLAASALMFLLLNYLVLPWGEKFMESGDQLTLAEKKLRQKKEMVAAAPQVQSQLVALQTRLDQQEKRLLPAADANQAGPQLQAWLAQRAGEQRLEVQRSDFLPMVAVSDSYVKVPVRLDLNGPITQVVQFMNAVTHSERIVSVDELVINSMGVDKDKRVHCTVVISSLMAKVS
jgi:Tfp pilus assembly protein PilO